MVLLSGLVLVGLCVTAVAVASGTYFLLSQRGVEELPATTAEVPIGEETEAAPRETSTAEPTVTSSGDLEIEIMYDGELFIDDRSPCRLYVSFKVRNHGDRTAIVSGWRVILEDDRGNQQQITVPLSAPSYAPWQGVYYPGDIIDWGLSFDYEDPICTTFSVNTEAAVHAVAVEPIDLEWTDTPP